jgi:ABC transporter substrate binding protein
VDAIRETHPPFSPEAVVDEFAALCRSYGVARVVGDRYAGEWPREQFRKRSIHYAVADKPKSDLYRDLLPLLNSGRIVLPKSDRLVNQLTGLERRTSRAGKDSIDHGPGLHDDLANAVAGAADLIALATRNPLPVPVQSYYSRYRRHETASRQRIEVEMRQAVPVCTVLQDPNSATFQTESREIEAAARAMGQKIITVKAGSEQEINAAFSTVAKSGAGALLVGGGSFFNVRRNQLVGLAALYAIPASYPLSGAVAAGGLVSYGGSQTDAFRRAGVYVARILKGEKPGDLPVELPTKFDLAINLRTAKALGLAVPPGLVARADEVIQ